MVGTNAVGHCTSALQKSCVANSFDGTGFAKWADSEVERPLMNPSSEEEELLPNSLTEKVAQIVDADRRKDKQPLLLTHLVSGQSVHDRKKVAR